MTFTIIVGLLVGGYIGGKYIKHQIDENNKIKEEQLEKEQIEKVKAEETNVIDSYLGSYTISYNSNLFNSEHPDYELNDNITLTEKCYYKELEIRHDGDVVKDCLSVDNAKTIDRYYMIGAYNLYLNSSNNIFYTSFRNLTKKFSTKDASNKSLKESELLGQYICFDGKLNELKQIDCPSKISNTSNQDTINTKYEFKLTKIK